MMSRSPWRIGQRVRRLRFERMAEEPALLYGTNMRSHYQGQQSTLSKHFKRTLPSPQLSLKLDPTKPAHDPQDKIVESTGPIPEQSELQG